MSVSTMTGTAMPEDAVVNVASSETDSRPALSVLRTR